MQIPAITALKADWILPVNGPPVKDSVLFIETVAQNQCGQSKLGHSESWQSGKIIEIKPAKSLPQKPRASFTVKDYGEAIITPGLINLHSHIDYSNLAAPPANLDFFTWLRALIDSTTHLKGEDWLNSAQKGAAKAIACGTTCLVDSSYSGSAAIAMAMAGLRGIVGLELFGIDESKAAQTFQDWLHKLHSLSSSDNPHLSEALNQKRLSLTCAPHAPYTVCPALWKQAKDWSLENDKLLLTHIAESQSECRWFLNGDEAVDGHLKYAFNRFHPKAQAAPSLGEKLSWKKGNCTPVEHLNDYELLSHNLLAAHLAYVNERDIETLAYKKVAVAHCPRSNWLLKNGPAPLREMLAGGLKMGLGTDSLASSPNLSPLDELRFARKLHRQDASLDASLLDSQEALRLITLESARCIGLDALIGSIEPGKLADLAVFTVGKKEADAGLPEALKDRGADATNRLIECERQLLELFVDGKSIYRSARLEGEARQIV